MIGLEGIFDTHAHYDNEAFDQDRENILSNLEENGIGAVVNVGASLESSARSLELSRKYPFVYAAAGVHPSETAELTEESLAWLRRQLADPKVVAVGEIGLDYYWPEPSHELQQYWFNRQLDLAEEEGMPVIIHSRDAAADTLQMIKQHYSKAKAAGRELTGVIHCFSYGPEIAKEYIKMGFWLGIGGVVTFQNARKLGGVVEEVPLSKLVLETDAPYLSPVPYRGQRNSSLNLPYVVEEIARRKKIPAEEVVRVTAENARKLYKIQLEVEKESDGGIR